MKKLIGSLLFLSMTTVGAFAQESGEAKLGKVEGMKLAKAECEAAWKKANPTNKPKISAGQANPFIADLKAANTNGDGAIDQSEFQAACDKGLMRSAMKAPPSGGAAGSASTGSGAGTEGAGAAGGAPSPQQ
jgi:hypothetical protein